MKKVKLKIPVNKQMMIVNFIEAGFEQGHYESYIAHKTYEFINAMEYVEKIELV